MTAPIIPQHQCGATPKLSEILQCGVHILRVECACGATGGTVMYVKPSDAERTRQAAVDGWVMAGA